MVFCQIQTEDEQWCAAPFLFRQDLHNSYWWARASFGVFIYVVKRGYIREPERRLFLNRPHHVLQATSPCVKKSRPQQHTWNSKGFVLSRSNLLLHFSLHFQHLVKSFKTPTVMKKLSSVLFILTANEHILTEFWLQIVEVAITSVGMSVQWPTTDYVHYFTI